MTSYINVKNHLIKLQNFCIFNQKTKQLLRDTQFLAEKLKNQEDENIRKIQDLKEHIEKEQHRLYIKDVEIKTKKMLYDQSCEAIEKLNEQIKKQNESFELQLTQASTNSDFVNNLKSQNELLTKEIVDLKETIHIRNIKIERMKKKLDSSN